MTFMTVQQQLDTGSLHRPVSSLIDGLSVESNYPRPDWKAGDSVGCHVQTKVLKPINQGCLNF